METAVIVKVAVSAAPYSIDKPYDYLVPEPWLESAVPGVRVTVPFGRGNRTSEGLILARGQGEKLPGLKPLTAVLDPQPVLDADGIALALWLRGRYFCTMFEAARTLLPAGLWFRLRQIWRLTESGREAPEDCRTPVAQAAIDALQAAGGQAELERLEEACGPGVGAVLRALEKEGAVTHETAARRKVGDRTRSDGRAWRWRPRRPWPPSKPPPCLRAEGGGGAPGRLRADRRCRRVLLYRRLHAHPAGHGAAPAW